MARETVHSSEIVHSYQTPHKYPVEGQEVSEVFRGLGNQLYPTGRAWYLTENSSLDRLHQAINLAFSRLINDGKNVIESTFPDTEGFTEQDINLWEYRLGLITNPNVNVSLRREAVKRKLAYPGNVAARQHPRFIQSQLQAAGFDVYIHENTQPYRTPQDIANLTLGEVQHGGDTQHDTNTGHGGVSFDVIANSVDPNENYSIGGDENLWSTFFISGQNLGDIATVPASRLMEFRELVLKLKPAHSVAFLFINFG